MSKNKIDVAKTQFYDPHMGRSSYGFGSNPTTARTVLIERMYMRVLTELLANRFKWENLPEDIDPRYLELSLTRHGLVVFFMNDDYDKHMALQGTAHGNPNYYDNPTAFTVNGGAVINKTVSADKAVPIWGNYLRQPDMDILYVYAPRLAQLDRTIEINTMNMRQNKVIVAAEHERQSWVNIIKQMEEGLPIFGTNELDLSKVTAIDLSVHPDSIPKLLLAKAKVWNECMTLLGIDNANQDKAERLVADEVQANNQQIQSARMIALKSRKEAAERINAMFGMNLDVKFNVELESDKARDERQANDNVSRETVTTVPRETESAVA